MDLTKHKANDVRKPDMVTAELRRGFEWTTNHTTLVFVAIIAFVAIGGGYAGWQMMNKNTELDLQAKYFDLEKQVAEKKASFDMAKAPAAPGQPKPATPAVAATGDMSKDYGDLPAKLSEFAKQNPKTKAGAMAALSYAGLMADYNKTDEAIATLREVKTSGLLSGLVDMQLATMLANSSKCDEATTLLEKMLGNPATSFLKLEAKLKIGLCAQQTGNLAKAEQNYLQVIEEGKDNALARSAQKYMRLLQLKKNTGASVN